MLVCVLECSCHPLGSSNTSCTAAGQCFCRPGVTGVKCDTCPESEGEIFDISGRCIREYPCACSCSHWCDDQAVKLCWLSWVAACRTRSDLSSYSLSATCIHVYVPRGERERRLSLFPGDSFSDDLMIYFFFDLTGSVK